MGKQGPCHHCGVTSTPLWRNGPPEKPILCNACGSRWRTKGTLANYTPLHARAETDDFDDQRASRTKSISLNKNKEVNLLKRKQNHYNVVSGGLASDYNQGFQKAFDEDMSNRSSSGSALSNSESCAQFGGTDASDLTGPAQSVVWDTTPTVPSKKRTCVGRAKQPSSVEKLTKDLCTILHEQQSCFSESSDGDLLYESEAPMVSVEIGHGSVLIRHPSYVARDEESEASSLSFDNGLYPMSDAYSYSGAVLKSDKSQLERVQILGNHDSPLCFVDLNDVVNYEEFTRNLSYEEQQQLLKFLPVVDTAKLPDGLKVMFGSSQFKENLTNFQQLLAKGAFDISLPDVKPEDCETLKRYALNELSKSKWVEHYHNKRCKSRAEKSDVPGSAGIASTNVANVKRMRDSRNQNFPEMKTIMRSPKRIITKTSYNPKSLFPLPPDASSHLLDSFNFVEESSDQDLLLEVPSNNSFPQAELLHPTSYFGAQASTSSSSAYSHFVNH